MEVWASCCLQIANLQFAFLAQGTESACVSINREAMRVPQGINESNFQLTLVVVCTLYTNLAWTKVNSRPPISLLNPVW